MVEMLGAGGRRGRRSAGRVSRWAGGARADGGVGLSGAGGWF